MEENKNNEVYVRDGYIEIALTGKNGEGKFALVDSEEYLKKKLHEYRWTATKYDYVHGYNKETQGYVTLHRLIMGLEKGNPLWVDHIYHNPLDNRKSKLRVVTPHQNTYNRRKNSTQKYKGVSLKCGKYRAQTRVNKKKEHFGQWETEELAAYAYNCIAKKIFGEYAYLNDVDDLLTDEEKETISHYVDVKYARLTGTDKVILGDNTKFTNKKNIEKSK